MEAIPWFLLALALAYLYAITVRPLLHLPGTAGRFLGMLVPLPLWFFALVIPPAMIPARAIALLFTVDLYFKLVDYVREVRLPDAKSITTADYLHFLIPYPILLVVYREKAESVLRVPPERSIHRTADGLLRLPATTGEVVLRLVVSAFVVAAMFYLVYVFQFSPLLQQNFWIDHGVKLAMFVILLEAGSQLMTDVDGLLGYHTPAPMRHFWISRTPAEFWNRYNTRINLWLERNVFGPTGGWRHAVRGVVLAFFVSAVLHEVAFDLALSRLGIYQFVFFMVQAPAVLLSLRLERFAEHGGLIGPFFAHTATMVWFYFTSIFFFHGVEQIFPVMYASQPWLP